MTGHVATHGLRTEWILDEERLRGIAPPWQRLADASALPFSGPEDVLTWWRHFGAGLTPRCCALWDGEALAAFLPLVAAPSRGLRSATGDDTSMLIPLARDDAALEALFDAVLAAGREVELVPLWLSPGARATLERVARRRRARIVAHDWLAAPWIATHGDFEAYRRAHHPSWMKRLARYRRQMERRHALELVVAEPPEDLAAQLAAGFAVEASGWKGREGTAMISSEAHRAFYEELAQAWHDRGELRLSHLALDGRVVAFDLAVERAGRLFSVKTGYDEEFRRIVPGLVLRLSLVEACFERGLEAHELLGATYDWKAKFATDQRGLQRVRVFPAAPIPLARWAVVVVVKPALRAARAELARRRTPAEGERAEP